MDVVPSTVRWCIGTAKSAGFFAGAWVDPAALPAGCFGVAFTGVPTIVAALVSDAVQAESFGAAYGVATLAFGAGLMAGPQAGGLIGDLTNSFRGVYLVSACAALFCGAITWSFRSTS